VDAQTGAIRVRLVFDNPKNYLKVGMSCVVRVHNQDKGPQLTLPNKAVVEQMGEYFVYVAKDTVIENPKAKTDTGKHKRELVAVEKKVKTGQTIGPDVIIKSGVNEGDRIVVDGVQSLHDGSQITTANKPPPSTGKGQKQ
jgi:multidrug efflux pump subunit AcrA (membrane-fusion protein)